MFEGTGAVATPEVADGAKAAADAINAAGGVDGSPIVLENCDLKNDPNAATACGNQAVSDGVVAVVGPVSANAGQYFPILEKAQIPVVGNVPASAADFTSVDSFPLYGGIVSASAGLADELVTLGGAKAVEPRPHRPRRGVSHRDLRQSGPRAARAQSGQRRQHPGRGARHVDLRRLGAAGRNRRRARRPQRPGRHELHHRVEASPTRTSRSRRPRPTSPA